jgi:hypothetical protein
LPQITVTINNGRLPGRVGLSWITSTVNFGWKTPAFREDERKRLERVKEFAAEMASHYGSNEPATANSITQILWPPRGDCLHRHQIETLNVQADGSRSILPRRSRAQHIEVLAPRRKGMNKAKAFGRIVVRLTVFAALVVIVFSGLATGPVVQVRADDENATTACTLATLAGSYGGLATGTVSGIGPITSVGIFTWNGAGKFVTTFTQNFDGKIIPYSGSGTYRLASNCTGTMTLTVNGQKSTDAIVVVTNGNEIDIMQTSSTSVFLTEVLKKIH